MAGLLVIISSPSGGGKDTVIEALIKRISGSVRMTTTTTRPPRSGEVNGVNYYFISEGEFKERISKGKLLEYNVYAGNYYGTEKDILEKTLAMHPVVFSNIEVNGKHNLDKLAVPHLSIFLDPESMEVLKARIEKRGSITPEIIAERLRIAEDEVNKSEDYDYHLVNAEGKLDEVVEKIEKIIKERLK
jgi:guanylate kinase